MSPETVDGQLDPARCWVSSSNSTSRTVQQAFGQFNSPPQPAGQLADNRLSAIGQRKLFQQFIDPFDKRPTWKAVDSSVAL